MTPNDYRFLERLRVRWSEVDVQRIVFNAHYLMYIDTAMAGYWRALALPYAETMHALGGDLFVRKASLEYLAAAGYDDMLHVGLRCDRMGRSSMDFSAAVFRDDRPLVRGSLTYVFADPVRRVSTPVPPALRAVLEAFDQGAPMVFLQTLTWVEAAAEIRALRQRVFVDEQGLDGALAEDRDDATAQHVVAVNALGRIVGAGRLLSSVDGWGRVGRLVAHPGLRRTGIGRAILSALVNAARTRGWAGVRLTALTQAAAFYARMGFQPVGGVSIEAGAPHQTFELDLTSGPCG